jgi:hypothetical protein
VLDHLLDSGEGADLRGWPPVVVQVVVLWGVQPRALAGAMTCEATSARWSRSDRSSTWR